MASNNDVETRIVEMQFDSRDFDKNIRQSQKTLEDFKKELNFDDAAKQMEGFASSGNPVMQMLSEMSANVKTLANDLVGIGSITTELKKKLHQTWTDAVRDVKNFAKSLTTVQFDAGGEKYNNLLKSVQTIKNATGDTEEFVYEVMDTLNKYTDETSYNFSDMAKNIGKFTTAGVGLKDAEKEMEGIANWAALAGQGVNEAQRAMYNISQAMSAGKMRLMDYRSIQNANMDIRKFRAEALKAAAAVGTLTVKNGKYYATKKTTTKSTKTTTSSSKKKKKSGTKDDVAKETAGQIEVTLDNFAETLQYDWFNKAAMEQVFKVFADNTKGIGLEAYKAAQRCVTFSDALNAIKDMLSTGWMKSYQYVFGKLTDAMDLFSGMCNKASEMLSKFVETRNSILERWSFTGRDSLWGALVGEIESPDGKTLFKGAYGLLDMMSDIGDSIYDSFWSFVRRFVDPSNFGLFDTDEEYRFNFLAAGLTMLTQKVQEFTNGIHTFFNTVPAGQTETRAQQIKNVIEAIFATIAFITQIIVGIGRLGAGVLQQLQPTIDAIMGVISIIASLITGSVVDMTKKDTIGGFFSQILEALRPFTTILNIATTAVAKAFAEIISFARKSGLLKTLGDIINTVLTHFFTFGTDIVKSDTFKEIIAWIGDLGNKLPIAAAKIKEFAKSVVESVKNSKAFTSFWDTVKKVFGKKNRKEVWKNVKGWFTSFVDWLPTIVPSLQNGLSKAGKAIVGALDWFLGLIFGVFSSSAKADELSEEVTDKVVKAVTPGGGDPESAGQSIVDKIRTAFHKVYDPIKAFFDNLFQNELPKLLDNDVVRGIKGFFAGTNLMDLLTNVTQLTKWLAIFRTGSGLVSMGKGLKGLGKGVKIFGKHLKDINLANIFANMFNISNVINSHNTDQSKRTNVELGKFGNQLLQIAAAIGVLTYSAMQIIKFTPEQLEQAGISLAALLGGLIIAGVAAKYLTGGGTGLLALAAGVLLLTKTLGWLVTMPWEQFVDAGIKLEALMMGLAYAMQLATGGVFGGGTRKLKGVIGFATAITILLIPIKVLSSDSEWKTAWRGILYLEAIMISIAGVAAVMGATNFNGFKGMLSFALAMTVLMIPIKMLSGMELADAVQGVGALLFIMGGIVRMARLTDGKKIAGLAGVVAAITALALVGWLVGHTLNWKQALVGFVPILGMLGMMSLLFHEASRLTKDQADGLTKIFRSFAVAVVVIAGAIVAISVLNVNWTTIALFFGGLIITLGMFSLLFAQASKMRDKAMGRLVGVFALISVMIGVIAGSIILISKMDVKWELVAAFFAGLILLVTAVGVMVKMLGKMDPKSLVIGIAGLAAAVIAIMGAVALMLPTLLGSLGEGLKDMILQISLVSGRLVMFFQDTDSVDDSSLTHAEKVFDTVKRICEKFKGFGDYGADIHSAMGQLSDLGTGLELFFVNEKTYPTPEQSKSFQILNKFIELGPTLSTLSFGSLSDQLMYLGVGIALFNESTKAITNAEPPALSLLSNISTAVQSFTGTITETFAENLMYLGVGIGLFQYATKDITSSETPALGMLQGLFGEADNIEKFTKLPLNELSGMMSALGGAMSLYAKGAKEVTGLEVSESTDVSGAITILKAVCNSIAGEGDDGLGAFTIPDNLPDKTALGLFAGQLEALGTALASYANAANSFKGDSADKSIALLTLLGQMGGYLTADNLGATKAFNDAGVHGTEDGKGGILGQFAIDVGALGVALGSFADLTANKSFDSGMGALDKLADINGKLNKDNLSFVSVFGTSGINMHAGEGTSTLGQFAKDIGALGSALSEFSTLTMDKTFDNGYGAMEKFADLNSRLKKDNMTFLSAFNDTGFHKTELGTFADDIGALGRALSSFATNAMMNDDKTADFDHALKALNFMITLQNRLPQDKIGGLLEFFKGHTATFNDLANQINPLGTALKRFSDDLSGIGEGDKGFDVEAVQNGLAAIDSMVQIVNHINDYYDKNYGSTVGQGLQGLSVMLRSMTDMSFANTIPKYNDTVPIIQRIAEFAQSLSSTFAEVGGIDQASIAIFRDIAAAISDFSSIDPSLDFHFPGKMISVGISEGVLEGKSKVVDAIVEVVQAGIDAGNATADVSSPSKVFQAMGAFMDMGLVKGLQNGEDDVAAASSGLVGSAIERATNLVALISQAMADELDFQPTITPILDLSKVTGAGSAIDGLFNTGYGLNLSSALDKAASATSQTGPAEVIVQNPTDLTGINAAIATLQTQLETLGTAISNMKLVLNTGVVAGGMTDDIDLNLGRKSLYNSRRN